MIPQRPRPNMGNQGRNQNISPLEARVDGFKVMEVAKEVVDFKVQAQQEIDKALQEIKSISQEANKAVEDVKKLSSTIEPKFEEVSNEVVDILKEIKSQAIQGEKGDKGEKGDTPTIDVEKIAEVAAKKVKPTPASLKIIKESIDFSGEELVPKLNEAKNIDELSLSIKNIKDWDKQLGDIKTEISRNKGGQHGGGFNNIASATSTVSTGLDTLKFTGSGVNSITQNGRTVTVDISAGAGSGVTSVASADGSITVTNPTTTPDLSVVKSPRVTTTIDTGVTMAGYVKTTAIADPATPPPGTGYIYQDLTHRVLNMKNEAGVVSNTVIPLAAVTHKFLTSVGADGTVTQAQPAAADLSDGTTGSGAVVLATSPTLVTPTLGVASATTINKVTLTAPATGSTLTIADGKTLTANNSITLAGTDGTTMTFPTTSATIARTDAAQTFSGTQIFSQVITTPNAITAVANAATVPISSRINNVTNNSAATLTITLTTTLALDGQLCQVRIYDFSAVAQTITWINTENSGATAPTTSNGSTTLPLSVLFQYNSATSKWRCLASA